MEHNFCNYSQFAIMRGCSRQIVSHMAKNCTFPVISVGKRKMINVDCYNCAAPVSFSKGSRN